MKILFILFWLPISLLAQPNNEYIQNYTVEEFFKEGLSDRELDFENIDLELLNATLFFTFNQTRKKVRRAPFEWDERLQLAAQGFINLQRGSLLKPEQKRKRRNKKQIKKELRKVNFFGTFVDLIFDYQAVINLDFNRKYFHSSNRKLDLEEGFYYEPIRKGKEPALIQNHTYQSFATKHLKRTTVLGSQNILRSKVYEVIGIATMLEQKSESRLPYLKILWLVGGYRLGMLKN